MNRWGLLCPGLADELLGDKGFEGFGALCEVVGADKVCEVASQLVMGFVVEAFNARFCDRPVHALDLSIGPGMLGFGEAVIDSVAGTGHDERMGPEWLLVRMALCARSSF